MEKVKAASIADLIGWGVKILASLLGKSPRSIGVSIPLGSGYNRIDEEAEKRELIIKYAKSQMGVPYKFGAEVDLNDL